MGKLLTIAGVMLSLVGLALILLPGPGYPVIMVGVLLLVAGIVVQVTSDRGPRQTP